jgi:UDP-N-acetyl-2-amino-2-deoxyglucuronate dehydrogenase
MLMSSASHRIYRLHYLVQSPVAEVHARIGAFGHPIETEDAAVLSLRFANGALGTIAQSCLDYPRPSELSLQLQGTRGAIRLSAGGGLEYWGREQAFKTSYEGDDAMGRELAEFVAAIREGRPPAVTGEDGRAVVAVLKAAYRSARSGTPEAV